MHWRQINAYRKFPPEELRIGSTCGAVALFECGMEISRAIRWAAVAGMLLPLAGLAQTGSAFSRSYTDAELRGVVASLHPDKVPDHGIGHGFRWLVPSDPLDWSGHWFIVQPGPEVDGRQIREARMRYISTADKAERRASWQLSGVPRKWLYLGLTGEDWPSDRSVTALAWQLELLDGSGSVLARFQSFLWEMPE